MLNPYTFPLVPRAALAPDLAARGGMGGWDGYELAAPSDRLLPFVVTRRVAAGNAAWISCAWIEHALTGMRLYTLAPVGAALPVPSLGLVLTKLRDSDTEYFTYDGALIPTLNLPCGVPLRLVVDNAYQSPLFYALGPAAQLPATHLPLEWYHEGPLNGVPYGRGFRQRFYLSNGYLKPLDARREQSVSKDPDTGIELTESLSLFDQKEATIDPVPAYVQQAFDAAQAPRFFLADGQPYKLTAVKSAASGTGRASLTLTLEDQTPLLRRGCLANALPAQAYPAGFVARGWRCGDTSDMASDYLPTGAYSCELANGQRTGYVLETYRDYNPYSPTYTQDQQRRSAAQDLARCPVPVTYQSTEQRVSAQKNDCPPGQVGSIETFIVPAGAYTSQASQADADAQAAAYAQANAQANANAVGTCQASGGATYMPQYFSNGCFSCQMVNQADPSDVRDATQDEVSRYYRATDNLGNSCPFCVI